MEKLNKANDLEFINGLLKDIRKHVIQFVTIGGHYQENKDLIDDMIQEASLDVLKKIKHNHSETPLNVDFFRRTIFHACLRTIAGARTITVPTYWLENREKATGANFEQDNFICHDYSAIEEFAVPSEYLISSFEENVSNQIIVADLLRRASEKERRVYRLIGAGFTGTQIEKIYGIDRKTIWRYLTKARRYLTTETNKNRNRERKGTGRSSRYVA